MMPLNAWRKVPMPVCSLRSAWQAGWLCRVGCSGVVWFDLTVHERVGADLSAVATDIRRAIALFLQASEEVWGEGEHGIQARRWGVWTEQAMQNTIAVGAQRAGTHLRLSIGRLDGRWRGARPNVGGDDVHACREGRLYGGSRQPRTDV